MALIWVASHSNHRIFRDDYEATTLFGIYSAKSCTNTVLLKKRHYACWPPFFVGVYVAYAETVNRAMLGTY